MKLKIEIKNRWTGNVIFEFETENNTIAKTVAEYIRQETEAGKYRADLTDADLTDANLTRANLTYANLTDADLTVIKNDMFLVLLNAIPEVSFLKQNIIEGKINGSTYDGECACLSGTLHNGATLHNGENEQKIKKQIIDCRDSGRPIERFFLAIKKGDTPENSQFSKLALEWIEHFESLIAFAK